MSPSCERRQRRCSFVLLFSSRALLASSKTVLAASLNFNSQLMMSTSVPVIRPSSSTIWNYVMYLLLCIYDLDYVSVMTDAYNWVLLISIYNAYKIYQCIGIDAVTVISNWHHACLPPVSPSVEDSRPPNHECVECRSWVLSCGPDMYPSSGFAIGGVGAHFAVQHTPFLFSVDTETNNWYTYILRIISNNHASESFSIIWTNRLQRWQNT